MPILSIVVTVFNKSDFIKECITSVLVQTFQDFELLIIDDGSTDNSVEICLEFEKTDKRVKVIKKMNGGVSSARNIGIKEASGKYIGFVDGDDALEPDMYEILLNNIIEYNADVSICGVQKIFPYKKENFYGTGRIETLDNRESIKALLERRFLGSVYDKIYKADLAKSEKFEGAIYEDIYYNFLIFQKISLCIFHDIIKYNYIIRDNSVSMSKFSKKYMDAVTCSEKMLKIGYESNRENIELLKKFDFVTNISILNLMLLTKDQLDKKDFKKVKSNLQMYEHFVYNSKLVSKKHKIAYWLYTKSKHLYTLTMRSYCLLTNAELMQRV